MLEELVNYRPHLTPVTWERAGEMHLLCSQAARKENSEVLNLLA